MKKLSAIGLNDVQSEVLAEKLNVLLANYSFFIKTAGAIIGTSKAKSFLNYM